MSVHFKKDPMEFNQRALFATNIFDFFINPIRDETTDIKASYHLLFLLTGR